MFKARLESYAALDESIKDLIDAAEAAKTLPNVTALRVAVLGQQGVGKTTLINALFDRYLLGTSGGSKACTAFVTIIKYKEGAPDDTSVSDVIIYFYNKSEMKICIEGQINNWWESRSALSGDQSDGTNASLGAALSDED